MKIEIFDQDRPIYQKENLSEGPFRIDCVINWPTTVNIHLSNKQPNDTKIDSAGNVIQDKAIEVTGVLINNFPIQPTQLDKIFICRRSGSKTDTNENWWGFNGQVQIIFNQPSPTRYMLSLKNEFDLTRLDWNSHD
jgi:hypothetical protein